MFAGNGPRKPIGFTAGFGDMVRNESPPNFGGTPGINPQGMMGRISGMGQQLKQRVKTNMDDPRRRQMLAQILSNRGMNYGVR